MHQKQLATRRLNIEHRPGAETLVGRPESGGFAYAGRFNTRAEALLSLLLRALSVPAASHPGPQA